MGSPSCDESRPLDITTLARGGIPPRASLGLQAPPRRGCVFGEGGNLLGRTILCNAPGGATPLCSAPRPPRRALTASSTATPRELAVQGDAPPRRQLYFGEPGKSDGAHSPRGPKQALDCPWPVPALAGLPQ